MTPNEIDQSNPSPATKQTGNLPPPTSSVSNAPDMAAPTPPTTALENGYDGDALIDTSLEETQHTASNGIQALVAPAPPSVSDNGGDVALLIRSDVAEEETQHTIASVPDKFSSSAAKHNRETIKAGNNNATTQSEPPHHRASKRQHGTMIGSSIRAMRGSAIVGDVRSSLQFGNHLPHDIEVCVDGKDGGGEDEAGDATWGEVCRSCCCHSPREWAGILVSVAALLFCLYFFLVGLQLMGISFQVVGGCTAGSILGEDTNPIASLMIGIIATTLLQSSSTTTSIIVSLVSGGLDIRQAIYMVMGANVGTAVTSIIVTLGHLGDGDELEKAFAGATVNFVFKILTVIILLPVEAASGYLYYLTKAMLPTSVGEGEKWEGPIKRIVSPISKRIIIANKNVTELVASGNVTSCDSEEFYPVNCTDGIESYNTCWRTGLIGCDEKTNRCPAFFQNGATKSDDMISGGVCLFLALFLLILCLVGLVALLRKMLLGASTRIIYKATNVNSYLAILIGCGVTVLVQSSSITTSTLVPLAGIGVLTLEQMYPLTIGADIGTTFTALMAAMVSTKVDSLQVALVHLFFNVTGFVLYYPVPFMRRIPLRAARKLGKATRMWRGFPFLFIIVMFFLIPLLLLGLSTLFEQESVGWVVLGSFLVIVIGIGVLYFIFWWKFRGGGNKMADCMSNRQRRNAASKDLPDDMDYLKADMEYVKNEIVKLRDFAGLIESSGRIPRRSEFELTERSGRTMESLITDEELSLYHTCRDKNWKDIIALGVSGSHRGLGASLASHQRYWGEL